MSTVAAGHTLRTHGTLAADKSLFVDAGNGVAAGGALFITGMAENDGFVEIEGSNGPSDAAATVTLAAAGVLINNGDIIVGFGGGLSGDGVGPTIQIYGTLSNNNLLRFGEGYGGTPDTMTIASSGVLNNSGTLQFFGGYSGAGVTGQGALLDVTSTGVLINTGLIQMKGAYGALEGGGGQGTSGTLDLVGNMQNFGTLQIDAANSYGGGYASSGSTVRVDGSNYFLKNYGMIDIGGSVGAAGGAPPAGLLSVASTLYNFNTITIEGGASAPFGNTGGLGGQLVVGQGGDFIDQGAVIVQSGQDGGAGGTLDLSGYTVLAYSNAIDVLAGAAGSVGGVFIERSILVVNASNSIYIGGKVGNAAASMTVRSGGVVYDRGLITGDGMLINQGYIGSTYSSQGEGFVPVISVANFVNDGTVASQSYSTFSILGGVSTTPGSTGLLNLNSSTMLLYGAVDAGQTVQFNTFRGGTDTLALGNASLFAGVLQNLRPATTIDFLQLDVTSASTSGDTLSIGTASEGTLSLALADPLAPGTQFTLMSDGTGGTDLKLG